MARKRTMAQTAPYNRRRMFRAEDLAEAAEGDTAEDLAEAAEGDTAEDTADGTAEDISLRDRDRMEKKK